MITIIFIALGLAMDAFAVSITSGIAIKSAPGFESACLVETAVQMGVRETRRIVGEYMLTSQEALDGARFDDVVAISANPMAALGSGRPHFKHEGFDIPYRRLVPRKRKVKTLVRQ